MIEQKSKVNNSTVNTELNQAIFTAIIMSEVLVAGCIVAWYLLRITKQPFNLYTRSSFIIGLLVGAGCSQAVFNVQTDNKLTAEQKVTIGIAAFVAGFLGTVGARFAVPRFFECAYNSYACLSEKAKTLCFTQQLPRVNAQLEKRPDSEISLPDSTNSSISTASRSLAIA